MKFFKKIIVFSILLSLSTAQLHAMNWFTNVNLPQFSLPSIDFKTFLNPRENSVAAFALAGCAIVGGIFGLNYLKSSAKALADRSADKKQKKEEEKQEKYLKKINKTWPACWEKRTTIEHTNIKIKEQPSVVSMQYWQDAIKNKEISDKAILAQKWQQELINESNAKLESLHRAEHTERLEAQRDAEEKKKLDEPLHEQQTNNNNNNQQITQCYQPTIPPQEPKLDSKQIQEEIATLKKEIDDLHKKQISKATSQEELKSLFDTIDLYTEKITILRNNINNLDKATASNLNNQISLELESPLGRVNQSVCTFITDPSCVTFTNKNGMTIKTKIPKLTNSINATPITNDHFSLNINNNNEPQKQQQTQQSSEQIDEKEKKEEKETEEEVELAKTIKALEKTTLENIDDIAKEIDNFINDSTNHTLGKLSELQDKAKEATTNIGCLNDRISDDSYLRFETILSDGFKKIDSNFKITEAYQELAKDLNHNKVANIITVKYLQGATAEEIRAILPPTTTTKTKIIRQIAGYVCSNNNFKANFNLYRFGPQIWEKYRIKDSRKKSQISELQQKFQTRQQQLADIEMALKKPKTTINNPWVEVAVLGRNNTSSSDVKSDDAQSIDRESLPIKNNQLSILGYLKQKISSLWE